MRAGYKDGGHYTVFGSFKQGVPPPIPFGSNVDSADHIRDHHPYIDIIPDPGCSYANVFQIINNNTFVV
jgi:hypothetical protein